MPANIPDPMRALEAALKRFDRDPMRSIAAAGGGDWDDLQAITKRLATQVYPFRIYEAATKMFQHVVRLQLANKDDSDPVECGISSVLGLISVHVSAEAKSPLEGERVRKLISDEGRDLADWFVRASNKILSDSVEPPTSVYTEFLCTFIRDNLIFIMHGKQMLREEDIFDIIIRLWVRAGTTKNKELEQSISVAISSAFGYDVFLTFGDRAHRVASQLRCTTETVIRVALHYLRREVKLIKTVLETPLPVLLDLEYAKVLGHIDFLFMLIPGVSGYSFSERNRSGEAYNNAFLEAGGLELVLDALGALLQQIHQDLDKDMPLHSQHLFFVSVLFGLLRNSLQLLSKASTITRVLDAGLVTVLVTVTPVFERLSPVGRCAIKQIILEMLLPWINFTSVLRYLKKFSPMRKLADTGILSNMMRTSALEEYWLRFSTQLHKRNSQIQRFVSARAKQIIKCENIDCEQRGPRESFQKCAGCEIRHYCSPKCQSTAWKEYDHKSYCIRAIELFKATHLPELVDLRYLSRVVFDDYHKRLIDGGMTLPPPGHGVLVDITQPLNPSAISRKQLVSFYKLKIETEDKEANYHLYLPFSCEAKGAIEGTERFNVYLRVKYSLGFQIHSFLVKADVKYGKAFPALL
ncbi:hypothetical protein SCHPADRAFT_888288 [Schizopora paradoxa]|uniref:MYND-type domain-containing protein n=1 Tax=Schizopora paradoxa TaxID=27342 RepID=A0A0H2S1S5_9AGAM|nr:hypothetical protein SCHPADRAFT_888288 [Schizopora paradoxa]